MAKYKETHPRVSRGVQIHDDLETKQKRREEEREKDKENLELKSKGLHRDVASKELREGVEATYLTPSAENFIETDAVKNYEQRAIRWLEIGYPLHLIGPTGCGKTALALKVAEKIERPTVWINGDETITTSDLIGGYSQVERESVRDQYIHNVFKSNDILKADWVDNPLTLACKYGYTLVYNEFSRTKPAANNILLSVLEEGILELPTKFGEERYVDVHPEFKIIFTSNNVDYAGVHKPQDALLDRLIGIHMDYYDSETEIEIVKSHTGISDKDAEKIVKVIRMLREEADAKEKPGTRACIMVGEALKATDGASEDHLEQLCLDAISSKSKGLEDLEKKRKIIKESLT